MKMISLTLPGDVKKEKLLSCLRRQYPDIPEYAFREAFCKKDVKLNGRRVSKDALTEPGATIQVFLPGVPTESVPILYRDENVVVVRKPAGVLCDETDPGQRTICDLVKDALSADGINVPRPLLCHRLDAPTEGVLMLALTSEAQEELVQIFREHRIEKEYLCQVKGCPKPEADVWKDWLLKDALHGEVRIFRAPREGAKEIVTEYRVVEPGEISLVRVRLHTGRTHQIRAHMAFYGYPLLGDDQYGDRGFNKEMKARRLRLCSCLLKLHAEGKLAYLNEMTFTCEPSFGKRGISK